MNTALVSLVSSSLLPRCIDITHLKLSPSSQTAGSCLSTHVCLYRLSYHMHTIHVLEESWSWGVAKYTHVHALRNDAIYCEMLCKLTLARLEMISLPSTLA